MAIRNRKRDLSTPPLCPYLTRFDAQQNKATPADYPSFENHCLAVEGEIALPLTDQATFCLSGSYRLCDRFAAIHFEEQPAPPASLPPEGLPAGGSVGSAAPGDDDLWTQPLPLNDPEADWLYRPNRRGWTWAGAAAIFAVVLLFGGGLAAYTGWQLVLQGQMLARANQPSQINTLNIVPTPMPTPAYVVVIATNPPAADTASAQPAPGEQAPAVAQAGTPGDPQNGQAFPEAVTPTPIVVAPPAADSQPVAGQSAEESVGGESVSQQQAALPATPANILLPTAAIVATPEAVINVLQEVPTRRPTPVFDLPTSTPVPLEPTATATATPTPPILGTPVVIFGPDESAVPPGECTNIRWHVVNVREVYYENQAAFGDGVKEECIDDEADSYALTVIFGDGQTQIFTTTVGVLWPTPTPSLTPSFTPEPIYTETWTPEPPTATPTPNVFYAVALRINGGNRQPCPAGTECEIAVLVTNQGDRPDNLVVEFLQRGSDSAWLCRQDGQCADQRLALTNVGQGNTAFVTLRLTVPADSAGTVFTYVLRAISDGSQGTVTSDTVTVEVESQSP